MPNSNPSSPHLPIRAEMVLTNRRIPDPDRLSSLPDSVLAYILSFLDTKSAIRTSILSKRYLLSWTLLTCLDFSLSYGQAGRYIESYDGLQVYTFRNSGLGYFESSVNRILRLRENSDLVKFRLSLHKGVGSPFLSHCIRYAADHKVQHLRIRGYVRGLNPVSMPESLLNSSSLVSLHLHNATSTSMEMPISAKLPNLKLLRLKNFGFCDRNFDGEFFKGCPNLETLVLGKCWIRPRNALRVLEVKCLNLKNLEIWSWRSQHKINVQAPKLVFFLFQGLLERVNFDCGLPCLKEACVDLSFTASMANAADEKRKTLEGLIDMLRQMCNVGLLSLSWRTLEVMDGPALHDHEPIIFENLRLIRFTDSAQNTYMEVKMPVDIVKMLLESADNVFKFYTSEKCRNIVLPACVTHFFVQSSPSLEHFVFEVSKDD